MKKRNIALVALILLGATTIAGTGFSAWYFEQTALGPSSTSIAVTGRNSGSTSFSWKNPGSLTLDDPQFGKGLYWSLDGADTTNFELKKAADPNLNEGQTTLDLTVSLTLPKELFDTITYNYAGTDYSLQVCNDLSGTYAGLTQTKGSETSTTTTSAPTLTANTGADRTLVWKIADVDAALQYDWTFDITSLLTYTKQTNDTDDTDVKILSYTSTDAAKKRSTKMLEGHHEAMTKTLAGKSITMSLAID